MRTVLAALAAAILLASSGTTAWLLYTRFQQTNRNRAANLETWHDAVCFLEKSSLNRPGTTPEQRDQTVAFFGGLLKQIHARPCSPLPTPKGARP